MKKEKQDAIKKLLNINDKEFEELQDKVLEDWSNNLITTQSRKSVDDLIVEINETGTRIGAKTGRAKKGG